MKVIEAAARDESEQTDKEESKDTTLPVIQQLSLGTGDMANKAESNPTPSTQSAPQSQEDADHEDAVFMQSYIPRNLNEVYDPERDAERVGRGEGEKDGGRVFGVVEC